MFGWIGSALGKPIIDGVLGFFKARAERKQTRELVEAKIKAAKVNNERAIELKDAEWESLAVSGLADTWKDEYLTVIITSPILLIILGGVVYAFTGSEALLDGTDRALSRLVDLGIDMGNLMLIVTLAGVGLKMWRAK